MKVSKIFIILSALILSAPSYVQALQEKGDSTHLFQIYAAENTNTNIKQTGDEHKEKVGCGSKWTDPRCG